jgi:hypothetical protein
VNTPRQGRNERCRCGSGKKYKHCHGSPDYQLHVQEALGIEMRRVKAEELQRQRQQGLGRPIISTIVGDHRIVAVRNRVHYSTEWKTFHDFLSYYAKTVLGSEWGNAEMAKPVGQRHPIIDWYQRMCLFQQTFIHEPGKVHTAPMNGATSAFLKLAYDLYALDHNAELQDKLLARLRMHDQFSGALYETFVAATFIRAGFSIEFEDETDRSSSHCEFTATHSRTGRSFSVEAKKREGVRPRIVRLFNNALDKQAKHARVIFIDFNMPYEVIGVPTPEKFPEFLIRAQTRLRNLEREPTSATRPSAYVFVTNFPAVHYLDTVPPPGTALIEGFKIPDFKGQVQVSLREAINARARHVEMHELMRSMQEHVEIPSTFDGENPELAFSGITDRIVIGQRYMVPGLDGAERPVRITTAVVMEGAKAALCGGVLDDGQSTGIFQIPLSDVELAAWRRHPDTFFGEVTPTPLRQGDYLGMYDFFHESMKKASKEDLLRALANAPDFEWLRGC